MKKKGFYTTHGDLNKMNYRY